MAQHDYVIANGTGAAVRSDLNNGLAAIVSQNSGTTEPTTTYAYMRWADTTAGVMKMRNGANNAWITLYQLDGEWSTIAFENGSASAPSIYFKDSGTDTGIYSPGTDQVAISTAGTGRLFVNASGNVGLGTSSPASLFHISGAVAVATIEGTSTTSASIQFRTNSNNRYKIATPDSSADLAFYAGGTTEAVRFDSSGRVGIGTTSPEASLDVSLVRSSATHNTAIFGTTGTGVTSDISRILIKNVNTAGGQNFGVGVGGVLTATASNQASLAFYYDNGAGTTEGARIDASGRLLVGTSSARDNFFGTAPGIAPRLQLEGADTSTSTLSITRNSNDADGPTVLLGRSRGTGNTVVQSGDRIGRIQFQGNDATSFVPAAVIESFVDGTPGTNDMPGRLTFSTTADGASSPTERMRIVSSGDILFNKTAVNDSSAGFAWRANNYFSAVRSDGSPGYINRLTTDGALLEFAQDSVTEGTISVSGTTVTYGGGHLARWSQLPNDEAPSDLLKGTVMSNLDEMCEWGEEDNEQLNRTKISDVEGDSNVAGVFVSTSFSDDGPLDFFVAMTGDMIVRIAEGVTVQRGGLLMSAGDGTAKPQDDDIIRSKTIAKVTSTHVTCTYDDGSYCVPCVLMAC